MAEMTRFPRHCYSVTGVLCKHGFNADNQVLIKSLYQLTGYNARQFSREFPSKGWTKCRKVNMYKMPVCDINNLSHWYTFHAVSLTSRAPSRSRYPAQPPNFCQPNISRKNTASRNMSTSAASVPVECLFSTTCLIANSKRSSLSADLLHKITFIHDNCKLAFQWLDFSIWVTMTSKFNNIQTVKQCVQH